MAEATTTLARPSAEIETEIPASMRMAVMDGPRHIEVREVGVPEAGLGEVLLRVQATAICTWEQRTFTGQQSGRFPFMGGHETAGIVVAKGPGAREDLEVGDRVALGPIGCGTCHYCLTGQSRWCPQHYRLAVEWDGAWGPMGFAEYRPTRDRGLYKVDPGLPFSHACLAEPLACAVRASQHLGVRLADDVVVIGAGPMGLLNLLVAKRHGARVLVADLVRARADKAVDLGADEVAVVSEEDAQAKIRSFTDGRGARAVIVAVGSGRANELARSALAPGGRMVLFAGAHPAEDLVLDPNEIHDQETGILGSVSKSPQDFYLASRLLSKGLIDVSPLIEAELPLERIQEAMELAIDPHTYRVIVRM